MFEFVLQFAGPFLWEVAGKDMLKSSVASIRTYSFSIWLYENPQYPLISMISGFLDVSLLPKTNIIYLLRPRDTSNNPRNPKIMLRSYCF